MATSPGKILPVADAKDENGWPLYEVKTEGFALSLPPDWRQFDMNPATFEAKLKETLTRNPQLESLLGSLRQQVASGVKFFGFDEASMKTGFTTNVNVLRLPVPPGRTLDMEVMAAVKQMESLPTVAKPIFHERLKMTTGDCERLRYQMTMKLPSGKDVSLAITQYVLIKDNDSYAVTLTTTSDQEAKYTPTFEKIGQSFRLLK
jgi:hypothetical protein